MKIGNFWVNLSYGADRERQANPLTGAPGFGRILANAGADTPIRYDASATAETHGFGEMPIVAPAHIDHAPGSSNAAQAVQAETDLAEDTSPPPAPRPALSSKISQSGIAQTVSGNGIVLADADIAQSNTRQIASPAPTMNAATIPENGKQSGPSAMEVQSATQPAAVRAPARTSPLAVHVARTGQGAKIAIAAGSLSEDEQNELASQARDMARSLGIKIDEIRISGFNGRK